jgi:hypothetical protein
MAAGMSAFKNLALGFPPPQLGKENDDQLLPASALWAQCAFTQFTC